MHRNEVLVVEPWVDYNKQPRFAILEINGATAPVGEFGGPDRDGEYQPAPEPTGAPWDRVLSWRKGWLVLGAGDYAVVTFQFRLGDGNFISNYPEVMQRVFGLQVQGILLDTKSTEPNWTEKAKEDWNSPMKMIQRMSNPHAYGIATGVLWDFNFMDEYYKPVCPFCISAIDFHIDGTPGSTLKRTQMSSLRNDLELALSTLTT
jgi:hypothetical protein